CRAGQCAGAPLRQAQCGLRASGGVIFTLSRLRGRVAREALGGGRWRAWHLRPPPPRPPPQAGEGDERQRMTTPATIDLTKTPSFRLDGRRALVTGGGRGIGLAAASALAAAGAHVTLAARTTSEIEAAAAAIRAR